MPAPPAPARFSLARRPPARPNLAALCDRYGSPERRWPRLPGAGVPRCRGCPTGASGRCFAAQMRAAVECLQDESPHFPDRRSAGARDRNRRIAAQMRAAVECLQDESPHFPDVHPRIRSSLTIAPSCGYRRANLAHAGCGGRIAVRTVGNPRGTVGNPPCSKGPQRGTAWSGTRYVAQVVGRINRVIRVERWPLRRSAPCDSPFIYNRWPSWDVAVVLFCLGGALISGMGVMLGFRQNRPGPRPNYGSAERCMTLLAGVLQ